MPDDLFTDIESFLRGENPSKEFSIVTEAETDFTILQFAESRGKEGFTDEEVYKLLKWIEMARINNSLVDLWFKGFVYLDDPTGEFGEEILVKATPLGLEYIEKLT